jgi:hypothetical protein
VTLEERRRAVPSRDLTAPALRPWQRLGVKLALAFAVLTLLAVGLVGVLVHERQKREVEDTVGTQLLNIARTAVLLVDPALHAEVQTTLSRTSPAYVRIEKALASVQTETLLTTPMRTLADFDPARRSARLLSWATDRSGPVRWWRSFRRWCRHWAGRRSTDRPRSPC